METHENFSFLSIFWFREPRWRRKVGGDVSAFSSPPILGLSPHGAVTCLDPAASVAPAFAESEAVGLLALGGHPQPPEADGSVHFWKGIADEYLRQRCQQQEETPEPLPPPDAQQLTEWTLNVPPMRGAEYLSPTVLAAIWTRFDDAIAKKVEALGGIAAFLEKEAPAWSKVGRITLHLAENPQDPEYPFAFLATYASDLSRSGRLTRLPLGKALQEYSGAKNKRALLKLLTPLQRAAENCPLLADLFETGDLYHSLVWTPEEAYQFLQHTPVYEAAGLQIRLPNWWKKRGRRPKVAAVVGQKPRGNLGLDALLDFHLRVEIEGRKLTKKEIETLLRGGDGLVLFRGEWIEVDREKLQQALEHWRAIEAAGGTLSLVEGMRLLAGAPADLRSAEEMEELREWAYVQPGEWLQKTLRAMAQPTPGPAPKALNATLRPYQAAGLEWLWFCAQAGLGACLADDMGLGKTIQLLALLLRRKEKGLKGPPCLLIVPASLIGNWKREAARFAPSLRLHVAHRSEETEGDPAQADLVITTYGMITRLASLTEQPWSWIILDEAQAIKNHAARQSKAVRALTSQSRIALTGTPVENHPGDLWSLFDFLNPGLLGSASQFKDFLKKLRTANQQQFAPLRRLTAPYILRRLKTDKTVISDLPDKTEMKVFCGLTPLQAKLYDQTAKSLRKDLAETEGMQRRGLVLAYLMRFKQLCNHPDQLSKAGGFDPKDSGKFLRLRTICEELAERGEKALVFTQFREMTEPLESALATIFGRSGLVLHGGTPVKRRQSMVEAFQREEGPPFFILSLKAGGTGLNLTAASHVVHFDRWWNPAVENQATDRAFRIGQTRSVLVHQFVTSGTLEERIDQLLTDKRATAEALLSEGAEKVLTEMGDDELLDFVRLDLSQTELET